MPEIFKVKTFANGLTLLGLELPSVESAAFSFVIKSGSAFDPTDKIGSAAIANEWLMRGASGKSSKELNESLDSIGSQHNLGCSAMHIQFSSAQLGRNLPQALKILADIFLRPNLDEKTFAPCKELIMQDLALLEDEPSRKCTMILRENFFPAPYGHSRFGTVESLSEITADSLAGHIKSQFSPNKAILAVAGNFDWQKISDLVSDLFADWTGEQITPPAPVETKHAEHFIYKDTAQTQIGIMHTAASAKSDLYYPARIAEAVLSRGMGSRLFTEVREKKALCYGISSQYLSVADSAGMLTYAGTRPELAQQTLDVTIEELVKLEAGITEDELARAKTQIRSMMIMQGQSTSARAGALVSDWYTLGRLRSLEELNQAIQDVTCEDVKNYLQQYPAENFALVTIGPKALKLS